MVVPDEVWTWPAGIRAARTTTCRICVCCPTRGPPEALTTAVGRRAHGAAGPASAAGRGRLPPVRRRPPGRGRACSAGTRTAPAAWPGSPPRSLPVPGRPVGRCGRSVRLPAAGKRGARCPCGGDHQIPGPGAVGPAEDGAGLGGRAGDQRPDRRFVRGAQVLDGAFDHGQRAGVHDELADGVHWRTAGVQFWTRRCSAPPPRGWPSTVGTISLWNAWRMPRESPG